MWRGAPPRGEGGPRARPHTHARPRLWPVTEMGQARQTRGAEARRRRNLIHTTRSSSHSHSLTHPHTHTHTLTPPSNRPRAYTPLPAAGHEEVCQKVDSQHPPPRFGPPALLPSPTSPTPVSSASRLFYALQTRFRPISGGSLLRQHHTSSAATARTAPLHALRRLQGPTRHHQALIHAPSPLSAAPPCARKQ